MFKFFYVKIFYSIMAAVHYIWNKTCYMPCFLTSKKGKLGDYLSQKILLKILLSKHFCDVPCKIGGRI